MAKSIKKKTKKTKKDLKIASVSGDYDSTDLKTDQAILDQMRSQGGLTPKTEAQMQRIIERMRRRSWD
jgi:hypothetical protein